MSYASLQDLIDRVGEDELTLLAGRDDAGGLDVTAVERAAADADAEIDPYLGKRFAVPFDVATLPRVIKRIAIDITLYRLADIGGVGGTDPRRQRYEDAISLLKRIASGDVSLGVGGDDGNGDSGGNTPEIVGDSILDEDNPPRRFGRGRMGGWPS